MTRRLIFDEEPDPDPDEDAEHVLVRRVERGRIRVTIEVSASAHPDQLALARDLDSEIHLWFQLDGRQLAE